MKQLFLLRHGESWANAGYPTDHPAQIPLTDKGIAQIHALPELWRKFDLPRPTQIVASQYTRAQETARPLAEAYQQTIVTEPLCHEVVILSPPVVTGTNNIQRKPLLDAYWEQAEVDARHGEGAETFRQFSQRVTQALNCFADYPHHSLIVGHGTWFARLWWHCLGFKQVDSVMMRAFRQFHLGVPMPNCALFSLTYYGNSDWHMQAHEGFCRAMVELS
jgi:broad specificity phosphatase PhoE